MNQVTKSLYDPSPAGYHVADPDAFLSCLTGSGTATGFAKDQSELVGTTSFDVNGEFFVTLNGGALYIPFSGCRSRDNNFLPKPAGGTYNYGGSWTAGRGNNKKGSLTSKLCMVVFTEAMWPLPTSVQFYPGLGFETASVGSITEEGWDAGTNAWPVIPQKGH